LGTATESREPRPARVGGRDLRLRGARLDNALRMLAQAGKFNLVIRGELKTPVSVELTAVEPYDALVALAEAHGLAIRYRSQIVIVTPDEGDTRPPGKTDKIWVYR